LERGPLEVHGSFDRVHEIGNQIMTTLELDVDLLERVERLVLEGDQPVVRPDQPPDEDDEDNQQYQWAHGSSVGEIRLPLVTRRPRAGVSRAPGGSPRPRPSHRARVAPTGEPSRRGARPRARPE